MIKYINKLIAETPYPVIFTDTLKGGIAGVWKPKNGWNKYSVIKIHSSLCEYLKLTTILNVITIQEYRD